MKFLKVLGLTFLTILLSVVLCIGSIYLLKHRIDRVKYTYVGQQPFQLENIYSVYRDNLPYYWDFSKELSYPVCRVLKSPSEFTTFNERKFDMSAIDLSDIDFSKNNVILMFGQPLADIVYCKSGVFPYKSKDYVEVTYKNDCEIKNMVYIYTIDKIDIKTCLWADWTGVYSAKTYNESNGYMHD